MFKFIQRMIDQAVEERLKAGSSTNSADAVHLDLASVGAMPPVDIAPVYAAEAERAGQANEPTLSKALDPKVEAAVRDAEALLSRGRGAPVVAAARGPHGHSQQINRLVSVVVEDTDALDMSKFSQRG